MEREALAARALSAKIAIGVSTISDLSLKSWGFTT